MTRLFDKAVAQGIITYHEGNVPTVVQIDEVAEYFERVYEGEGARPTDWSKLLQCLAPPWPVAFFQYRDQRGFEYGAHVWWARAHRGWEIRAALFVGKGARPLRLPIHARVMIDEAGKPGSHMHVYGDGIERVSEGENIAIAQTILYPVFFAVNALHCRGTVLTEQAPRPSQLQAMFGGRKKPATKLHTFHTLRVPAIERVLPQVREAVASGNVKALHLCRGHFKTYTADAPLFGHYVGQVFCPPHLKGNKALGFRDKDYQLAA